MPWTNLHELIAQAVDELGIIAAEKCRPEPTRVERPEWVREQVEQTRKRPATARERQTATDRVFSMLLATSNTIS